MVIAWGWRTDFTWKLCGDLSQQSYFDSYYWRYFINKRLLENTSKKELLKSSKNASIFLAVASCIRLNTEKDGYKIISDIRYHVSTLNPFDLTEF